MDRRRALSKWVAWTLFLGVFPIGLSWLAFVLKDATHLPSIQRAFGDGRPVISAFGLLMPSVRAITTSGRGKAFIPYLMLLAGVNIYAYAQMVVNFSTATSDQQRFLAIGSLVLLGASAMLGLVIVAVVGDENK